MRSVAFWTEPEDSGSDEEDSEGEEEEDFEIPKDETSRTWIRWWRWYKEQTAFTYYLAFIILICGLFVRYIPHSFTDDENTKELTRKIAYGIEWASSILFFRAFSFIFASLWFSSVRLFCINNEWTSFFFGAGSVPMTPLTWALTSAYVFGTYILLIDFIYAHKENRDIDNLRDLDDKEHLAIGIVYRFALCAFILAWTMLLKSSS